MVGHVEDVVAVDEEATRAPELLPFLEKFPVLVEDLDAVVGAVADEDAALGVDGNRVRRVELSGRRAFLAPRLDELPVLRELDDARVGIPAVPVRDEDVAVWRGHDVAGAVERVRPVAGDARLAQGHQHLAFRAEFEDLVAFAVLTRRIARPDVAVPVDVGAVRLIEHSRPEHPQYLARRIELDDGRQARAFAVGRAAALEDPDVAFAVDIDSDRPAPFPAVGERSPALFDAIRIVLCVCVLREHRRDDGRRRKADDHSIYMAHDGSSLLVVMSGYLRVQATGPRPIVRAPEASYCPDVARTPACHLAASAAR